MRGQRIDSRTGRPRAVRGWRIGKSGYLALHMPAHPLASADGRVLAHRAALFDRIGPGSHPCHWCRELVSWDVVPPAHGALEVDHLDGNKANNHWSNLVPSCHRDNAGRRRTPEATTLF